MREFLSVGSMHTTSVSRVRLSEVCVRRSENTIFESLRGLSLLSGELLINYENESSGRMLIGRLNNKYLLAEEQDTHQ